MTGRFPPAETVRGRILGALLRGNKMTQQDALRRFGNFRLAADVGVLRQRGWPIETEIVEVETSDAGRRADVARYSLPPDAIAAAGDAGQDFAEASLLVELSRRAA